MLSPSTASHPPQQSFGRRRRGRYRLISLTLALAIMLLFIAISSTPAKASSSDPATAPAQRKRSASGATKKQARAIKELGTLGSFTDALPVARTFLSGSDKGAEGWAQQLQGLNGEQPVVTERREQQAPSQGEGGGAVRMQKRSEAGRARLTQRSEQDDTAVDYLIARKQARNAKPFLGSKGRAEQRAPEARQQQSREEGNGEGESEDVYDDDYDSIDEQGRDAEEEEGRYSVDPATHPLP